MQIGDKVYLKAVNNLARGRNETFIKEDIITKIGRKYYEVGENRLEPLKFSISDNCQVTKFAADWELYFSKQEILDEEEFKELCWKIESKFNRYGTVKLTLEQLRRINKIIEE